ncbi:MAG TPA: hypothetical protein VM029_23360, partial [Opitutaceae bacterium]|nr:hypothetical protein [Opitutaceae bacterium]
MHDRHATEDDLILHYYGEPDADARVEDHVKTCAQCRVAFQELSGVLALVDAQAVPEPLAGLEQRVWSRVQPEIQTRRGSWFSRLFDATPRWAFAGGIATLVLAAFVAGRFVRPDAIAPVSSPANGTQVATANGRGDVAERMMTVAVGDHLDESEMVLLELLNGDATQVANIGNE